MSKKTNKVQQYKIDAVEKLGKDLEKSGNFLFADYRGLTVAQITELRNDLGESGSTFRVVKNSRAQLAFGKLDDEKARNFFIGPTALAFCGDDAGTTAKVLVKHAKDTTLQIKGGLLDGKAFNEKEIEAFSKLPTRTELVAMLMGTMKAPVQNLVSALNGVSVKLVRTLDAVREQKESQA